MIRAGFLDGTRAFVAPSLRFRSRALADDHRAAYLPQEHLIGKQRSRAMRNHKTLPARYARQQSRHDRA